MASPQHGRYQIIRSLAAGGMAEVFLARVEGAAGFSKLVALKRIHAELADDDSFVERFIDEARIAARLNHPNIVQILDLGLADGTYFIAMEYVHGKTLWDLCREAARRREHIPLDVSLGIMVAACEGLGFAHDHRGPDGKLLGIVHRDVSPQNLLVSYDGAVKVADFGIALATGRMHKTEAGAVVGKLSYMAPEQMLGQPVDQRTDLYALGVMLHELLTGQKLFTTTDLDPARRARPVPPSSVNLTVPAAVDAITLRALSPSAGDRYPNCDVLRSDLEAVMAQHGIVNSTRRRAELMQTWFPEDRTPPTDAGPTARADKPQTSMPTIELQKSAFESMPTMMAEATDATSARGSTGGLLARRLAGSAPGGPSAEDTQTRRPVRGDGGSGRAILLAPAATTPPRGEATVMTTVPQLGSARMAQGNSGAIRAPLPPLPTGDSPRRTRLLTIIASSVLVGVALLYVALRPGEAPAPAPGPASPAPVVAAPIAEAAAPELPRKQDVPVAQLDPRAIRRDYPHDEPAKPAPKKERGAISLTVTPAVQVYLGKSLLGRTPLREAPLPAGKNKLRLVGREQGIELALDVDVRAGETVERSISVGKARLRIKALPWASVKIDGNELGQTPLPPQSLYAGTHTIVLTYKPEGAPPKAKREQLTLKDGEDRLLEADLR